MLRKHSKITHWPSSWRNASWRDAFQSPPVGFVLRPSPRLPLFILDLLQDGTQEKEGCAEYDRQVELRCRSTLLIYFCDSHWLFFFQLNRSPQSLSPTSQARTIHKIRGWKWRKRSPLIMRYACTKVIISLNDFLHQPKTGSNTKRSSATKEEKTSSSEMVRLNCDFRLIIRSVLLS